MHYNKNTTINIECIVRSVSLEDWDDLTPSAITIEASPSTNEVTVYNKSQSYVDDKWDGTDASLAFEAIIDDDTLDNDSSLNSKAEDASWEGRFFRSILVLLEQYFSIDDNINTKYLILPQAAEV